MKKIIILLLALMVAFTFISCDEPEVQHEHKWDEGKITTVATCTKEGIKTYKCSCGETKTEEIPALGHTEVVDPAVAPTCTEKGKTEGKHCSVCNEVLVPQEEVVALGHTIDATGTCKRCDATGLKAAKIGAKEYVSLSEAVNDAEAGATITMLCDAAGNGIGLYANEAEGTKIKDITIDFNGFTQTIDGELQGSTGTVSQAFHLEKDCTVILKNGTITSTKASMLVQNYCDLTLENMILDYVESKNDYALSVNHGDVKVINTQIKVAEGKVAFDSCKFSTYTIPTVTVSGTSQIEGAIELSGGTLVIPEAMKDNIKYAGGYDETKYTLTTKDGVITAIAK